MSVTKRKTSLNNEERSILQYIYQNNRLSKSDLIEKFNLKIQKLRHIIRKLKELNLVTTKVNVLRIREINFVIENKEKAEAYLKK